MTITRLGMPAPHPLLATAHSSAAVPDMQYKFRLVIGPLMLEDYWRFLPGGNNLPVLTELVRAPSPVLNTAGKLSYSLNHTPPLRLLPAARTSWAGPHGG